METEWINQGLVCVLFPTRAFLWDKSLKEIGHKAQYYWTRNRANCIFAVSTISKSSAVQAAQTILCFFTHTFMRFSNGKTGSQQWLNRSKASAKKEWSRNPRCHLGWLARWRNWQHWQEYINTVLTACEPHCRTGGSHPIAVIRHLHVPYGLTVPD